MWVLLNPILKKHSFTKLNKNLCNKHSWDNWGNLNMDLILDAFYGITVKIFISVIMVLRLCSSMSLILEDT